MINNELLREVLGVAMSSGGDFAELYAEHLALTIFNLLTAR